MTLTSTPTPVVAPSAMTRPVLLACPDSRPPAYQAAIGLGQLGLLGSFHTALYYKPDGLLARLGRKTAPGAYRRVESKLLRRHDGAIPADRVRSSSWVDGMLALENRQANSDRRRALAIWRTRRFDRRIADAIQRERPGALLTFSDVGSVHALGACREAGIPTILSMVTGHPLDERRVLVRENERLPEFARLYLGDGQLDRELLDWLHERRLREIEAADRVLVPSHFLADRLVRTGVERSRIAVIPYAADTGRFRPDPARRYGDPCTFLFAGGLCQRKGIVDLLKAWGLIRRPGWRLQLLGALPKDLGPLAPLLDQPGVEWLGRVGHAEVPARMAAADVFVFPSLFEGSAVVTYEALASGLPSIVTPESGSIVRGGLDGLLVSAADPSGLAEAMERLGRDPERRAAMSASARERAESFGWDRYHEELASVVHAAMTEPPATH